MTVRTRMAPSPTGDIHAGGMATVLKNFAYAKKHGGQFVLRIEDTDQNRKVSGAVEQIFKDIKDYGLNWDEGPDIGGQYGPYTQSERLDIYREHVHKLIDENKAYYCFCSPERLSQVRADQAKNHQPPRYDQHCRHLTEQEIEQKIDAGESYVVRLKVPANQEITFTDLIRGDITFNSSEVDDQVLLKSDGYPTYHLAVVVDDHLMQISVVMRGEEWISSTPKHVLLYQAFGWKMPKFAHLPVFLNPDGKGKMSKRKGTVSARSFLDQGFLPEAMLNFFMILGWTPKDQREILSLEEYIAEFDPKDLNPNSVVFDLKKLAWLNGIYIRRLGVPQLIEKLKKFIPADCPESKLPHIVPLVSERMVRLSEFEDLTYFFYRDINPSQELLLKRANPDLVKVQLSKTIDKLESINNWSTDAIEKNIRQLQEENDWQRKQYFMMLRTASMGEKFTPPLFESMAVFAKPELIRRLKAAATLVD